jgi:hypothetical protein
MARKKKKAEEPIVENPVVAEVETPTVPVVEEKTELEKVKELDKKIAKGAKAREEMKQAWKKRINTSDSQTNQYTYNLGSIL